jgi:hypothetical protein
VHRIEDAGHWPFIDRPDAFAAVLLPFLKEQIENRGQSPISIRA